METTKEIDWRVGPDELTEEVEEREQHQTNRVFGGEKSSNVEENKLLFSEILYEKFER